VTVACAIATAYAFPKAIAQHPGLGELIFALTVATARATTSRTFSAAASAAATTVAVVGSLSTSVMA